MKADIKTMPNYRSDPIQTFADFFCGIGGFHFASATLNLRCIYACDIDDKVRNTYEANFGMRPEGDINSIKLSKIPSFDLLCAGPPCQPFSIIGKRQGIADSRGGLFFKLLKIIEVKRPKAVVLENVRQLLTIDNGRIFRCIVKELKLIGYFVDYRVLNALDFGLPQKRERVLIVATRKHFDIFPWPMRKVSMKPLAKILEKDPDIRHFVSDRIKQSRHSIHKSRYKPGIWHENKGGNVSSHPFSCALRAGASHNYLLVDGERRLTPREMLRLQGFPDKFRIICTDSQIRKQTGNAVPIPLARAAIEGVLEVYAQT